MMGQLPGSVVMPDMRRFRKRVTYSATQARAPRTAVSKAAILQLCIKYMAQKRYPDEVLKACVAQSMALASKAASRAPGFECVAQLLSVFAPQESTPRRAAPTNPSHSVALPVDSCSKRELEILRLIQQGRSNQQISERLFVSLSTVKWHNQNIFAKLQVRRRTEAVARALELNIMALE